MGWFIFIYLACGCLLSIFLARNFDPQVEIYCTHRTDISLRPFARTTRFCTGHHTMAKGQTYSQPSDSKWCKWQIFWQQTVPQVFGLKVSILWSNLLALCWSNMTMEHCNSYNNNHLAIYLWHFELRKSSCIHRWYTVYPFIIKRVQWKSFPLSSNIFYTKTSIQENQWQVVAFDDLWLPVGMFTGSAGVSWSSPTAPERSPLPGLGEWDNACCNPWCWVISQWITGNMKNLWMVDMYT